MCKIQPQMKNAKQPMRTRENIIFHAPLNEKPLIGWNLVGIKRWKDKWINQGYEQSSINSINKTEVSQINADNTVINH